LIPAARIPRSRRKPDAARRLRDVLRAELLADDVPDGPLPSEGELMLRYGVGRNIVRAALAQLQREGLVTRVQGAGTFVVAQKIRHRMKRPLGIRRSVAGSERRVLCSVLAAKEDISRARVSRQLEVADGEPCGVFDVLVTIDGVPSVVQTSYVPLHLVGPDLRELIAVGEWYGDWYHALDLLAVAHTSEFTLEAVAADGFVAPLLDLDDGEAMLLLERVLRREDGTVFEYGFSYCRGDRVAFVVENRHELPGRVTP
jgi:GntR family transcriptional regulator